MDTFRILLATDNHIGYNERDPIRGQDSINTFKEILQLAVKNEVDMIVLSGDLFHENRPSRDVLYEVIALLREYTMGSKPVEFELLSDPDEGKADGFSFPGINSEDPNLNVGIPVLSIHGNHDDPQGTGPAGALSAMDLLSVTGLINYIGKSDLPHADESAETDGLLVKPVLLRKGTSHLAIYGIGNVKDTRMHYELRSNRVRMYMPDDEREWFNMLLIHQNRVKHGPQESVPETMFDERVDLVVWGHEHDCRIVPEPVAGKPYMITQPGSSVATSLAEGESLTKYVALVEILDGKYELTPLELRTVRPFVMETVALQDELRSKNIEVDDQAGITKFLKQQAVQLITRANREREEKNRRAVERGEEPLEAMLPLVRLRVDTTGVPGMSNPIRFGQEFTGKVANPKDMLVFSRQKQAAAKKTVAEAPDLDDLIDPDLPNAEKFSRIRVSALVNEYLKAQSLELLAENGMSNAVMNYVDKDDTHSISESWRRSGSRRNVLRKKMKRRRFSLSGLLQRKANFLQMAQKGKGKSKAVVDDDDDFMDVDGAHAGAGDDDDFEDDEPPKPAAKGKGRAASAAATQKAAGEAKSKPKSKVQKLFADSDEDMEEDFVQESELEEEEEPPKLKGKKPTTSRASIWEKTPASGAKKAAGSSKAQSQLSFAPTQTTQRTSRAAASKARGRSRLVTMTR
ncbi:DNA repair exonuclease [Dacryopinax primogenitus]|uniref:Double-strand break repair protein n=1 Tax=Dacryopinax primogenitus (strain DJM 731) TaxID=1858805 RepID=M5FV63_DACPD|nr:DNA repair exonuclease [Dacryopinax primogenitus]EJU01666.1 DNA repair exonuclease [Dacryopinax primogenitus]